MKISFFADAFDNKPEVHNLSWDELLTGLSEFQLLGPGDKLKAGAFSPAELVGGKKLEHVQSINFGVLDLDDVTLDEFTAACARVEGYDAFIYTTWRHAEAQREAEPLVRARLLVRFSRPALPSEWQSVWRALAADFGLADPQCKDPTRIYFVPSMARGNEAFAKTWRFRGKAWDVDAALASAPAPTREPTPFVANDPISDELLTRLAGTLLKKQDTRSLRLGTMLQSVLKGNVFAAQGGRDNALWELAKLVAERFPQGSSKQLSEFFRRSLDLMAETAPDCPTVEQVREKIERAQRAIHEANEAAIVEADAARGDLIELAYRNAFGQKRRHPYTPEELKSFGDMRHKWIVQKGSTFFVFFHGTYQGPFTNHDAGTAMSQWLAPSALELASDDGPKPIGTLVKEYGQVVREIITDLAAQTSYLDGGTFIEATCPLQVTEGAYDPEVDTWLCKIAGEKRESFLDWLAAAPKLDRPAPALYLIGAPGTGKSLLAAALAQVWGREPTDVDDALDSFNESIARCPLILADEKMPTDYRGRPRTDELKRLISRTEASLKRKFVSATTMRGAVRVILCANNRKLIDAKTELTTDDAVALSDRLIAIDVGPESREWLEQRGGQEFTAKLMREKRIAKHIIWLSQNRKLPEHGRFIVPGNSVELLNAMQVGSGCRWSIMFCVHAAVLNPEKHARSRMSKPLAVRVSKGQILVHPGSLRESWDSFLEGERVPDHHTLDEALKGLLEPHNVRRRLGPTNYRILPAKKLQAWCEQAGEPWEDVEKALITDTESRLAN